MRHAVWILLVASSTAHADDDHFARDLAHAFPPGAPIARGSAQKLVYAVDGRPDLVLRVLADAPAGAGMRGAGQPAAARAWLLAQEHDDLATLAAHGWPTLEVLATGHIDGRPADVVPRFTVGTKDAEHGGVHVPRSRVGGAPAWRVHFPDGLDDGIQADLHALAAHIAHGPVAALDLQLLLRRGRAVVFDPAGVVHADQRRAHHHARAKNLRVVGKLSFAGRPR